MNNTTITALAVLFLGSIVAFGVGAFELVHWLKAHFDDGTAALLSFIALAIGALSLSAISDYIRGDREEDEGGW